MAIFSGKLARRQLGALALALLPALARADSTIAAYNTYAIPPFVISNGGLAADLVGYLNSKLHGRYVLQLHTLPRNRLNQVVMAHPKQFDGVVLFANKTFLQDPQGDRYLWSAPILEDANLVVSNQRRKVEYRGPHSLVGRRFGGVNGHIYANIDELARQGALIREDAYDERLNLAKLDMRRIDFTLLPQSFYRYLQLNHKNLLEKLYVAPQPHSVFSKHILVGVTQPELMHALQPVVAQMKTDPAWQAVLAKYNLGVDSRIVD